MRALLLLALGSLLLVGVTLALPEAGALCSGGDPVGSTCGKALCTAPRLADGTWLGECWGVVGPPP